MSNNPNQIKDTANYETSEAIAIKEGKDALSQAPWLSDRKVEGTDGFFVELRRNDHVHPKHYATHCVDGNGTKLFLSPWSGKYHLAPIDSVAMNANDMATVIHAVPSALNIYIACQTSFQEEHMGEVMSGFVDAAERIRIPGAPFDMNIGKIETASLDEMISLGVPGMGHDFGVVMSGYIEKDKVPRLNPKPGHVIVGVSSTGVHSNGLTGARHVLFSPEEAVEYRDEWKSQYRGEFMFGERPEVLGGQTVLDALQAPTALYLAEAAMVGREFDSPDIYGINITGNGLHNFNRAGKNVAFNITNPLPPLPIHQLMMQVSGWDTETAYRKQNMGMGFAYVVPDETMADEICDMINKRGKNCAQVVGFVDGTEGDTLITRLMLSGEKTIEFVGYEG